jgi:IclR family acetate operon transcriptional repressor
VQNESQAARRPEYPIASVGNALTLLSLLGERERVRVADAARELGTARSTAHRLLAMLEFHGFARQDPATRAYVPGRALIEAGLGALGSLDIRAYARPVLERLVEETDETVHLVVLEHGDVLFLDSVETSRTLRIGSRTGRLMPAHCTAAGKAVLSQLSPGELHGLYPGDRLEPMTPRSLPSLGALEAELVEVRRRGYATNFGESEPEVAAVAVPIPAGADSRPAAVTVSAPVTRLDADRVPVIAEAAIRAVAELDGGRPGSQEGE